MTNAIAPVANTHRSSRDDLFPFFSAFSSFFVCVCEYKELISRTTISTSGKQCLLNRRMRRHFITLHCPIFYEFVTNKFRTQKQFIIAFFPSILIDHNRHSTATVSVSSSSAQFSIVNQLKCTCVCACAIAKSCVLCSRTKCSKVCRKLCRVCLCVWTVSFKT